MNTESRGRARFGILVPFTNTNLEPDFQMLRPPGVSLHFARLGGYDQDEIPDEKQMAGLGAAPLAEPLKMIAGVRPDVIFYGCTSATLAHGRRFDRSLASQIHQLTGAQTVTAAGAVLHALQTLGVQQIGFASPYVASLNDRAVSFIEEAGIAVCQRADYPEPLDNYGQGALSSQTITELAAQADHPRAEAIVLSCTDMRSVEVVSQLEATLGKPVVTSNQAMMFEAVSKLAIPFRQPACGQIFDHI